MHDVRDVEGDPSFAGYLFAYFTGDSTDGEYIRFALSDGNDALRWRELNGGRPVLTSSSGTRGLRDPFLVRGADGFHLLATDLSIGAGISWESAQHRGSRSIEIWSSPDLISWSAQRHVEVAPHSAGDAWGPEAVFDECTGEYLVFWASMIPDIPGGAAHHRMLAATTRDFVTFSEATIWQNPGWSVIDATVIRARGRYHRFTKSDGVDDSHADVVQEVSADLRAASPSPAWRMVQAGIGDAAGLGAVEGPIVVAANAGDPNGPGYYLFLDEYQGRGYVPLFTADLEAPQWCTMKDHRMPRDARHGSVLPVTATEMNALWKAFA